MDSEDKSKREPCYTVTVKLEGFLKKVSELLKQPAPPTEPYTPPNEEVPPSRYIPLAHR
jgi:hypothetical protein